MKTLIVAEIGSNWEGSLVKAKKLIYECKNAGADVIKFQMWRASDLYSPDHPEWKFIKKSELSFEKARLLKKYCDKMVSGIDYWIGKILEKIDLTKTLIVITSDHGEYIPISSINHEITYIPSLVKSGQKIKKFTPKHLHPLGESIFVKFRDFVVPIRKLLLKTKLSEEEIRTLNERGTKMNWELYDEVVRTPLLFSGYGIKSSRVVNQQVRQIDIFPTILSIVGLPEIKEQIEGKSLLPAINGKKMNEEPALIENQILDPHDDDIVIGIRTPQYKYFRDRSGKNNKTRLFDLKNDPHETNNIATERPNLVQQMENLLVKHRKNECDFESDYDDEEVLKIKDELKKMGYIN